MHVLVESGSIRLKGTQIHMNEPNANTEVEKLDLSSLDVAELKRQELVELFPEVRTEGGKIDFERLKAVLGEMVDAGRERYGMNWPGKAQCMRTIQAPSMGTLLPMQDESADWDTTENVIIEGDNLEVLKLLQKSYLGQIKMIYIDPPYNTGKDFIYPDNYTESLQTYLEYTGQVDSEGRKFGTNTDADGRFHSKWLNMMYPRLFLSRNLLSEDGVIFISIDENEFANLKRLCDEIYGEENLLSVHHFQVRYENKSLNERKAFQEVIEYVLIYARNKSACEIKRPTEEYSIDKFKYTIKHDLTPSKTVENEGRKVDVWLPGAFSIEEDEPSLENFKETWISGSILTGTGHGSLYLKQVDSRRSVDGDGCLYRIHGIGEDGLGYRYFTNPKGQDSLRGKMFTKVPTSKLAEIRTGDAVKHNPIVNYYNLSGDIGNIRHEGGIPFNAGKKPTKLISQFLNYINDKDCLVLDFFAGSGTTGHAVMLQNAIDGGKRKFILVQLQETLDPDDKDNNTLIAICDEIGKPHTVSELTKERLRRSAAKIRSENPLFSGDLGFRSYLLAASNFIPWDGTASNDAEQLAKQLQLGIDHTRGDRTPLDLLFEVLLKSWGEPALSLKVGEEAIDGVSVFSIAEGAFLICLEEKVTLEIIRALAARKPDRVVMRESAFAGNDQLKTNAVQTFKSQGVTSFKVV